jgi:HpcH/HpaI aldolase/citrate lyase family
MRPARSFLYVPANREEFLEKAIGLTCDAFIFDLEDSVPPAGKENARAGVRHYAPRIADSRVWVRPNGLDTPFAEADLDAVIGTSGIAGIFVPKVESREEVLRWDAMIAALERARGVSICAKAISQIACSATTTLLSRRPAQLGTSSRPSTVASPPSVHEAGLPSVKVREGWYYFFAAPNGAVPSSNSSTTVPGMDSSARPTVMLWPSAVRTLAMCRGCQSD